MHVLRERVDYSALKERANAHARAYKANKIVIEDAGAGTYLIQVLNKLGLPVVAVRPERDKKTRLLVQLAKFEAGLIYFPRQAPWLAEYEAELLAFPNVRFDDQVDSTSQALAADHSDYNFEVLADGMARLSASLAFEPIIRSLYHSKFG
jgi:predicted phage terminase large subunit-like protein